MEYVSENISLIRVNPDTGAFNSGEVDSVEGRSFSNLFYPYLVDNGGVDSIVSLTIDIMNRQELHSNGAPNEKWHNSKRQQSSLVETKPIWGFKETTHPTKISQGLSNAFCFSDQNLTFHIATEGHGTGYVGNQWLYVRQSMEVSYLDVLSGNEVVLYEFSDFNSDIKDPSRFFEWVVPEQNVGAFVSHGLLGMFVLRIEVTNQYFYDAAFEKPYDLQCPDKNLSLLSLLTYSAAKELTDVTEGGIDILDESIAQFESLEDIFEKTIFDNLTNLNENDLTVDQKRAIVADQVAVVFMSQHPVLNADYYPSKILGYGMKEGVKAETIINKAATYAERFDEVSDLAADRLFGMVATVEKFNFSKELEEIFPNHSQSNQIIKDPSRVILVNESGELDDDLGVEGILFNPYAIETAGTEMLFDVQHESQLIFPISIDQGSVGVDNITILGGDGLPLVNGLNDVVISFRVLHGEEKIQRIRYTLWTKNSLNHVEWIDATGLSRSHRFFDVQIDYDIDTLNTSEIINCRLDFEDENGVVDAFYAEKIIPEDLVSQGTTVVDVSQRQDGSGLVDIYYDYFGTSEINNTFVSVSQSVNGIDFTDIDPSQLRGDTGSYVMPGRNKIVWYPYQTYSEDYPSSAVVKLSIQDADLILNSGVDSNTVTLDLYKPEVAVRKVNLADEPAIWESSSSSSSIGFSSSSSSIGFSSSSSSSSGLYPIGQGVIGFTFTLSNS